MHRLAEFKSILKLLQFAVDSRIANYYTLTRVHRELSQHKLSYRQLTSLNIEPSAHIGNPVAVPGSINEKAKIIARKRKRRNSKPIDLAGVSEGIRERITEVAKRKRDRVNLSRVEKNLQQRESVFKETYELAEKLASIATCEIERQGKDDDTISSMKDSTDKDAVDVLKPSRYIMDSIMFELSPGAFQPLFSLLERSTSRGQSFNEKTFLSKLERILLHRPESEGHEHVLELILKYLTSEENEPDLNPKERKVSDDTSQTEISDLLMKLHCWTSIYAFGIRKHAPLQSYIRHDDNDETIKKRSHICAQRIIERLSLSKRKLLMQYLNHIDESGPKSRTSMAQRCTTILGKRAWLVVPEICAVLGLGINSLKNGRYVRQSQNENDCSDSSRILSWVEKDAENQETERKTLRNLLHGLRKRVVLEKTKIVGPFSFEALESLANSMEVEERAVFDIFSNNNDVDESDTETDSAHYYPSQLNWSRCGVMKFYATENDILPTQDNAPAFLVNGSALLDYNKDECIGSVALSKTPQTEAEQEECSLKERAVFVQNLPSDCGMDQIRELLSSCGEVSEASFFYPPETPKDISLPMINQIAEVFISKKSNKRVKDSGANFILEKDKKSFVHARVILSDEATYRNATKVSLRVFGVCYKGYVCRITPAHLRTYLFLDAVTCEGSTFEELKFAVSEALQPQFDVGFVGDRNKKHAPLPLSICIGFTTHRAARLAEITLRTKGFSPFWFYHHDMHFGKKRNFRKIRKSLQMPNMHNLSIGPSLLDGVDHSADTSREEEIIH